MPIIRVGDFIGGLKNVIFAIPLCLHLIIFNSLTKKKDVSYIYKGSAVSLIYCCYKEDKNHTHCLILMVNSQNQELMLSVFLLQKNENLKAMGFCGRAFI